MKAKTVALITHTFERIGSHSEFTPKELAYCLKIYLFTLTQHDVINSDEYKELSDIVRKVFTKQEVE